MQILIFIRIYILIGLTSFIVGALTTDSLAQNLSTMPKLQYSPCIFPPLLQPGDTVAIVAPAWWATTEKNLTLQITKKVLNDWGLEVIIGKSMEINLKQFGGGDDLRQSDLQNMINDPTIKAIFSYRGGYGTTRIIDRLNFSSFLLQPKWLIGFSDITTIHLKLHHMGVVSIHGEMPKNFPDTLYQSSLESLRSALFSDKVYIETGASVYNRLGEVMAPVVGGNLTMICSNIGTSIDLNTMGKILVIEDIGEQLYAIDRMMVQLKRSGKLKDLAGLIVGNMVGVKDKIVTPFGKNVQTLILEHVAEYGYPVAFNMPISHRAPNIAFWHGAIGMLVVHKESSSLSFQR